MKRSITKSRPDLTLATILSLLEIIEDDLCKVGVSNYNLSNEDRQILGDIIKKLNQNMHLAKNL